MMNVQKNDYAILIGVADYPNYKSLKGPKKDIVLFKEWLVDKEKGGGVPEDNIQIITSTYDPASPLHSCADQSLSYLFEKVKEASEPARRLYFYFSGHGFGINTDSVALALANWKQFGYRNSALKSDAYLKEFVNWGKFEEVIFFLDCCRSPMDIDGLPPSVGYGVSEDANEVGQFIAYSTRNLNAAFEASFSSNENEYVGIFTKVLLDALWGDASGSKGVLASRLKEYLDKKVPSESSRMRKPQKPEVVNRLNSNSIFGVADSTKNVQLKVSFKSERFGEIQLLDPYLELILQEDIASEKWTQLELRKGRYTLIELATEYEIDFKAMPSHSTQTIIF